MTGEEARDSIPSSFPAPGTSRFAIAKRGLAGELRRERVGRSSTTLRPTDQRVVVDPAYETGTIYNKSGGSDDITFCLFTCYQ